MKYSDVPHFKKAMSGTSHDSNMTFSRSHDSHMEHHGTKNIHFKQTWDKDLVKCLKHKNELSTSPCTSI